MTAAERNNDLSKLVERVIRPDVREMRAYMVQSSPAGMIKLDAMENPFTLPPDLQRELGERLGAVAINRYPGSSLHTLRTALAEFVKLPEGCELLLGNGSDELITLLSVACDVEGASVLAPVPAFVMYDVAARLQGLKSIAVPLTADFELDEKAMLAAIAEHRPTLVYIAYPNNPTANLFDSAIIDRIIAAAPGLVVIDEAYQPFSSATYLDKIGKPGFEHVLLMRTLSKFGLAGIRLGYLIGRRELIGQIDKVRPPYNVSVLNAEAALFALEHADEFDRQATVLRSERARLMAALAEFPSVKAYPSEANMILVRVPDAAELFEGLKRQMVLIKNVSALHPLLQNCLRLTIGTPPENSLMIEALKANLK
ncbi:histidinol-phosphate transaminase [soil metagenome]